MVRRQRIAATGWLRQCFGHPNVNTLTIFFETQIVRVRKIDARALNFFQPIAGELRTSFNYRQLTDSSVDCSDSPQKLARPLH